MALHLRASPPSSTVAPEKVVAAFIQIFHANECTILTLLVKSSQVKSSQVSIYDVSPLDGPPPPSPSTPVLHCWLPEHIR